MRYTGLGVQEALWLNAAVRKGAENEDFKDNYVGCVPFFPAALEGWVASDFSIQGNSENMFQNSIMFMLKGVNGNRCISEARIDVQGQ